MNRKSVPWRIKSTDDATGTFTGLASVFDNVDAHGDIVRRGAFAKSLAGGQPVPLLWEHGASDPRNYVGDVIEATETAEGLAIKGRFDLDTDHGAAAYRNVKGRRVGGLSIGYSVRNATKTAAGNELTDLDLIEISVVARGANDRALIGAVKSAGRPTAPIRSALAKATAARYLKETPDVMTTAKLQTLQKDRDSQLALVKHIIDTADEDSSRDLTADEARRIDEATTAAKALDAQIATAKADLTVLAHAKSLATDVGKPLADGEDPAAAGAGHLALTGTHVKKLAAKVVKEWPREARGTKALASGQQLTSTIVVPGIVELGRPAVSLLDLLPARAVAPSYSFTKQSVRTNNAAPVAVGDVKPTSVTSVVSVENRLRVVAHISEQLNHYMLSDTSELEKFIEDEMFYGLRKSVEAQVISGDGTGENFTGILNTIGIVTQAFSVSALQSIRKSITTLSLSDYTPAAIVLSAQDWEALELAVGTTNAIEHMSLPIDPIARRLFGVPVVLNQGLGSKTGLVLGEGSVTLDHDGQIETRWSDNVGTDFTTNNVRCRVEGRFGVSVNRPGAVVKVATAA